MSEMSVVPIERDVFHALDDVALIWTCIEPIIREIRGKNLSVKTEASAGLTEGQRALLMFQIVYGHAGGGSAMLFGSLSYLLSHQGMWDRLRDGMRYLGASDMLRVLDELEAAYPAFVSDGALNEDPAGPVPRSSRSRICETGRPVYPGKSR